MTVPKFENRRASKNENYMGEKKGRKQIVDNLNGWENVENISVFLDTNKSSWTRWKVCCSTRFRASVVHCFYCTNCIQRRLFCLRNRHKTLWRFRSWLASDRLDHPGKILRTRATVAAPDGLVYTYIRIFPAGTERSGRAFNGSRRTLVQRRLTD